MWKCCIVGILCSSSGANRIPSHVCLVMYMYMAIKLSSSSSSSMQGNGEVGQGEHSGASQQTKPHQGITTWLHGRVVRSDKSTQFS